MRAKRLPVALLALLIVLLSTGVPQVCVSQVRGTQEPLTTGTGDLPPVVGGLAATRAAEDGVSPCYAGCGGEIAPVVNGEVEQRMVELVNELRAARGLSPFKRVTALDDAARYHATDMGQDDYVKHDTHDRDDGVLVWVCDLWMRMEVYYPGPTGETLGAGYATPEDVVDAWMDSPGHRDVLLSTYGWEIGAGYYSGSGSYARYWALDFGRRSGVYPLIINREAATTDSAHVSLYVYGQWDEIRLRNDDGSWSAWMPFQNAMSWTLSGRGGERTVWAEMRDHEVGQTASISDTITLIAPPSLGGLPDDLVFTYSIPDGRLLPASIQVTPWNSGNEDPLAWTVAVTGTWFAVLPMQGTTPGSFTVTPTSYATDTVRTYRGTITVTVTEPVGVGGSPGTVDLALHVVGEPFYDVYLPTVLRDARR